MTDTGIFEFHPEPLAVLLENQGSETCSKGNTHEFWVLVSYLETEELSCVKKRGQGLGIMKIEPKSLQSSATTSPGSSPRRFSKWRFNGIRPIAQPIISRQRQQQLIRSLEVKITKGFRISSKELFRAIFD